MPAQLTYPGVYVEEIPSGVHTITGVPTSIAAFVGRTARGPVIGATTITSYADFERTFGGLDVNSPVSFAVRDFFLNGGSQALIVRLFHPTNSGPVQDAMDSVSQAVSAETDLNKVVETANKKVKEFETRTRAEKDAAASVAKAVEAAKAAADATLAKVHGEAKKAAKQVITPASADLTLGTTVTLQAANPGSWGQYLRGQISFDRAAIAAAKWEATPWKLFNLVLRNASPGGAAESYQNLSTEATSPRRIDRVLKSQSDLAQWKSDFPTDAGTIDAIQKEIKGAFDNSAAASNDDLDKAVAHLPADEQKVQAAQQALAAATTDEDRADTQKKLDDANKKLAHDVAKLLGLLTRTLSDSVTSVETAVDAANKYLQAVLANPTTDAATQAARDAVAAAADALDKAKQERAAAVTDGGDLNYGDFIPVAGPPKTGLYALDDADIFNLLCLPSFDTQDTDLLAAAATYCEQRRAMLIVDPPVSADGPDSPSATKWKDANAAKAGFTDTSAAAFPIIRSKNAALYFPRVEYPNPLKDMQVEEFPPCGVVAGLYAKTDANRGVWKAPAGIENTLVAVRSLAVTLTDGENGLLNPLGINCLRSFPVAGRVAWGARTLRGADQLADEYKYVPVRRLALFIEESLYRGTQWAVFEPNDEPLWAQLRLNVGAFMHDLFRRGAFQGQTPQQAYLVKCDKETTTQTDINLGVVNVVVAFAPLKPAEFIVLKIQQLTGQIDT